MVVTAAVGAIGRGDETARRLFPVLGCGIVLGLAAACGDAGLPQPLDAGVSAAPDLGEAADATVEVLDAAVPADAGEISRRDASVVVPDAGASADAATVPNDLEIQGWVETFPDKPLQAVLRLTSEVPVGVSIRLVGPGVDREIVRPKLNQQHAMMLLALRSDSTYDVLVDAISADELKGALTLSFQTGELQSGLQSQLNVTVNEPSPDRGYTFFGVTGNSPEYVAVDSEGFIVWHYPLRPWEASAASIIRPLGPGRLLIMLADEFRIIDTAGNTLHRYVQPPEVPSPFHHEGVMLPDGRLLALSSEVRPTQTPDFGPINVLADIVVELDPNSNLLSRWSSFDTLDPTRFPGPLSRQGGSGTLDWTHSNAIDYSPVDDTYLVSVRNQNWVVNVDRATQQVLWKLGEDGDFDLTAGEWFTSQHASAWTSTGELMLYDNGNESSPQRSRAVVYALDMDSMTAQQTWEWRVPFFTPVVGDIDELSSGFLVTAGIGSGPWPASIFEVSNTGQVRWQLEVRGNFVYRAERVAEISPP